MSLYEYVTLGRSGLRVSPLCLGAMTFGTEWGLVLMRMFRGRFSIAISNSAETLWIRRTATRQGRARI